ncbi:MAG TPA: GYD domain-containing protein [Terracidiphilus sp.]|nr:GYD domain-containing protein [Terracidiphilus sp.]
MPSYLLQVSYTAEALSVLIKKPQDRSGAVGKAIEKLGGSLKTIWFAFGDYDVVGIMEMPDNVSAAGIALAIGAGGACRSVKTTPLLTIEEGIAALKKGAGSGYKPLS